MLTGRYEHLEDQLNDLTELHQHEMSDLKQELASIEERVAYQAQERARDIQVNSDEPSVTVSQLICSFTKCVFKEKQ